MVDIDAVKAGYIEAASVAGFPVPREIHTGRVAGPHTPPPLPAGFGAIYVFALTETYGSSCDAGSGRVLKVGKAGPASAPRFQYQHYSPNSTRSNLARSVLAHRILWPWLGIRTLDESTVGDWLRQNTDRYHLFISAGDYAAVAPALETYTRGVLGSVFEGSA